MKIEIVFWKNPYFSTAGINFGDTNNSIYGCLQVTFDEMTTMKFGTPSKFHEKYNDNIYLSYKTFCRRMKLNEWIRD
jgi:hypothetical protein